MAKVKLKLPNVLARKTGNIREYTTEADTVEEAFKSIDERCHGKLGKIVFDDKGELKQTITIYVNGREIRLLEKLETKMKDEDEITIIPTFQDG